MPMRLQEIIHKFEEGTGAGYLKLLLAVIVVFGLGVVYDLTAFRNFVHPEAMDSAQLGRNISEGRGFVTDFIRPFSLGLLHPDQVAKLTSDMSAPVPPTNAPPPAPAPPREETARTEGPAPDLANPPVYPLVLAAVLKVMPFSPKISPSQESFSVYLPDFWIGLGNQVLFLIAAGLVFILGRRLFDPAVGWLGAAVLVGTDLFWRYSISGLSTMLLTVILLALVLVLVWMEPAAREGTRSTGWMISMALLVGVLVGVGTLTRYGFAWVMVPVMIFLAGLRNVKVVGVMAATVVAAAVVIVPWLVRNHQMCGNALGTAGYAIYENTSSFPGDQLQRSLQPPLGALRAVELRNKFVTNVRRIVTEQLPTLGGSWATVFFLAGLLVPFRNPTLRALRLFVLIALLAFLFPQALTAGPPLEGVETDAGSLMVVVAPLLFLFGVSLFYILLEQAPLLPLSRFLGVGVFWVVLSLPLLLTLLGPTRSALAYPPYFPPWIQGKAERVERNDVVMSDMPWAVAWYGKRPSVWLSLLYENAPGASRPEDFYAVDQLLPVRALYLSGRTLEKIESNALQQWRETDGDMDLFVALRQRLIENWRTAQGDTKEQDLLALAVFAKGLFENWTDEPGAERSWEVFVVGTLVKREVPGGFPLQRAFEGLLPEIFLAETERKKDSAIQSE